MENYWSGWRVTRDGANAVLDPGEHLATTAPAGTRTYRFRYRPWDVIVGIILALVGAVLAVWLWLEPKANFSFNNIVRSLAAAAGLRG